MLNWRAGLCLVLVAGLCGCGAKDDSRGFESKDDVVNTAPPAAHVHGPHDGHILELGEEEFHAEVVIDPTSRKLSVYLLDEAVKGNKPVENGTVTIEAKVDGKGVPLELAAAPQDGETDGKSSRFELAGDKLPSAIADIEGLSGKLTLKFGEKSLTAEIGHDHDHDHGHGHAH